MNKLAVDDLERSLAFYRDGLGFRSEGVIGASWSDERTGAHTQLAWQPLSAVERYSG